MTSQSDTAGHQADDTDVSEPRWHPDKQLIPAILAGSPTRIADLSETDRCWVVAGLGANDHTAEQIADRLKCSLRLVRSIRALPLTKAFEYAQTETATWINEARLAQSAHQAITARLHATQRDLERTRDKLSRLIDAHITGTPSCARCGTPFDTGNTYFEGTHRRCRNCNRIKQQAYRERRKALLTCIDSGPARTVTAVVGQSPDAAIHAADGDGPLSQ